MADRMPQALLQVRALLTDGPGAAALAGLDAQLGAGLTLVIDEQGEAKTPLLRLLAGENAAAAGSVRWQGCAVTAPPEAWPQTLFWRDPFASWPDISPLQWAAAQAQAYPAWSEVAWQAHVEGLDLAEHLHKEMFRLSTGGKRKVLLAAALASGAALTLIDDPEAALDRPSIQYLRGALSALAQTPRVLVVASHGLIADVPWSQVIRL